MMLFHFNRDGPLIWSIQQLLLDSWEPRGSCFVQKHHNHSVKLNPLKLLFCQVFHFLLACFRSYSAFGAKHWSCWLKNTNFRLLQGQCSELRVWGHLDESAEDDCSPPRLICAQKKHKVDHKQLICQLAAVTCWCTKRGDSAPTICLFYPLEAQSLNLPPPPVVDAISPTHFLHLHWNWPQISLHPG